MVLNSASAIVATPAFPTTRIGGGSASVANHALVARRYSRVTGIWPWLLPGPRFRMPESVSYMFMYMYMRTNM